MSLTAYLGTVHNGLRITGFAGRDARNEVVFLADCLQCKTKDVQVPYRKVVQGNAVCSSTLHRTRQPAPTTGADTMHPLVVEEIARHNAERRAEREESDRRWQAQQQRLQDEYRRYKYHAIVELGFDLAELPTFKMWSQISNAGRERIMAGIEQGEK